MKKILIGLIILFLATTVFAFDSLNAKEITAEKETKDARAVDEMLCSGEYNLWYDWENDVMYDFYNGDALTEAGGNCNAIPRLSYWEEATLSMETFPQGWVGEFPPGLIFPYAERFGWWVESTFNWDFAENQCYTEFYTTRHTTADYQPVFELGEDFSYIHTLFRQNGDLIWAYNFHLPIENINRPVTDVATDRSIYTLAEGEDIVQITLTITDEDLGCGTPDWDLIGSVPIAFRNQYSAETFEIRINGQPVPLIIEGGLETFEATQGSFGINWLGGNTGEITFDWNSSELGPGEYDLNITVFDTDGYYETKYGPFIVEEYGSQIDKTVHLTKEGLICGNTDGIISGGIPIDVADLVYLVNYLFKQGPAPNPIWIGNVDGIINEGIPIDVADLVYLVNYLFKQGPAPTC